MSEPHGEPAYVFDTPYCDGQETPASRNVVSIYPFPDYEDEADTKKQGILSLSTTAIKLTLSRGCVVKGVFDYYF